MKMIDLKNLIFIFCYFFALLLKIGRKIYGYLVTLLIFSMNPDDIKELLDAVNVGLSF
jgi:hypothetical protein